MKTRAFTLIEIMVAISIIAILASVVAPNAFKAVEKAKVSRAIADIKAVKTAALTFYKDVGLFPGSQWGTMPGDALSPADYGEGFVDIPAVHSGSAVERARAQQGIINWDGPYLEKWGFSPWGMPYMWDYNNWDTDGSGLADEHILWLDLAHSPGPYNDKNKVPEVSRVLLDSRMDGGDGFNKGTIREMDSGFYGKSIEAFLIEGF
jgi:general secretion pathway protein G